MYRYRIMEFVLFFSNSLMFQVCASVYLEISLGFRHWGVTSRLW